MDNGTEVCMQNLKCKLNACTASYIAECGQNKTTNLTRNEQEGLTSLMRKKKAGEMVIFETDKSKRFSCDTPDNYKQLGQTMQMMKMSTMLL